MQLFEHLLLFYRLDGPGDLGRFLAPGAPDHARDTDRAVFAARRSFSVEQFDIWLAIAIHRHRTDNGPGFVDNEDRKLQCLGGSDHSGRLRVNHSWRSELHKHAAEKSRRNG